MESQIVKGQQEHSGIAVFGHARWDRATRRLTARGQVVKLPWRVAECLGILVDAAGVIVTKEDLQNQIWGGALVEESNLAQCVTALRKALDPSPGGGSHIETVARVGYRLAVVVVDEPEPASAAPATHLPRFAVLVGALALLTLLAGGLVAYRRVERREQAGALVGQGLSLLRSGSYGEGIKAPPLFQHALELAPNFALAHAGLAEGSARLGNTSFGAASELARLSVQEEPDCGECHAILGWVLMTREWKWSEAGRSLARSIALDPGKPQRRLWYATWLTIQNRLPEAASEARTAIRLDPSLAQGRSILAMILFFSGQYREANEECEKSQALNPSHTPGYAWSARSYMMLGQDINALAARAKELVSWASWPLARRDALETEFQTLYRTGNRTAVAHAWLDEVGAANAREVHRYNRAVWFMWIGEPDAALAELEAAVKSRPYNVIFTAVDPAFAPLRTNPRFQQVVRSIGLRP